MSRSLGVTRELHHLVPGYLAPIFLILTYIGQPAFFLVLFSSYYYLEPDRKGRFVVALGAFSVVLIALLKHLFGLPRPPSSLSRVAATGYGFPSGHAFGSTVAWLSLARITTFSTRNRRFMVAGMLTALVSLSRLVLGAHYLVDVVAGVLLGFAVYYLVFEIYDADPVAVVTAAVVTAVAGMFLMKWGRRNGLIFGAVFGTAVYIYLTEPIDLDLNVSTLTDGAEEDGGVGYWLEGRTGFETLSTFVLGGVLAAVSGFVLFEGVEDSRLVAAATVPIVYVLLSMPEFVDWGSNRFGR